MLRGTACAGGLRWPEHDVALECCAVGLLDGAQTVGNAGFPGSDGLAVAAAVGAFGQVLGVPLDFAEVGFALVGVRGEGEEGGAGGGGVQDEADGLAFRVVAGQGDNRGAVGLGPGRRGGCDAFPYPLAEVGEHEVGAVDLVAGGAEVLPDRAQARAAADGVAVEPGRLEMIGVGARAGVEAQLGLQLGADGAGAGEADQAAGQVWVLGAGGQPDGQPPGGDVIDGAVPGVGVGGADVDEPLVLRQVQVWLVAGQLADGPGQGWCAAVRRRRGCLAVRRGVPVVLPGLGAQSAASRSSRPPACC